MTWLIAIALAVASLVAATAMIPGARRRNQSPAADSAALALQMTAHTVPRPLKKPPAGWTAIAAALCLGLAGYALQASPGLPGSPTANTTDHGDAAWALVDERKSMVASEAGSQNNHLIVADGYARRGQYADAAALLRGAITDDPRNAEVWLALGNTLVEHAGGVLTEPALLAYRRAAELDPDGVGPGYFLGLALIRQGRLGEAASLWRETLETAADDAPGRDVLALRLGRLDMLLAQPGGPVVPK